MATDAKPLPETTETVKAESPCMASKPQQEHEWLQKLVGEWTCEGEAMMGGPDQPPTKWKATESVRALGGLWVVAEGKFDGPDGTPGISLMTLGYDPQQNRYVGTFVGSMMAWMWVYSGSLNEGKTVLTLDTEGPSMAGNGGLAKYQDIIELKSENERTLTSRVLGEDGQWMQIVHVRYTRTK